MNSQKLGREGEIKAKEFLIKKGYKIINQNWHCKYGELDIIAQLNDTFIFVEVKTRSTMIFGYPETSVSKAKQKKLWKTANEYIQLNVSESIQFRFDIISLIKTKADYEIEHFEDVFWM